MRDDLRASQAGAVGIIPRSDRRRIPCPTMVTSLSLFLDRLCSQHGRDCAMTSPRMEGNKIIYDCFLCGLSFQFGPNIYDGKRIVDWDIMVCDGCFRGN